MSSTGRHESIYHSQDLGYLSGLSSIVQLSTKQLAVMKKTLTLLLIVSSFSLSAQINKGTFMVGGSGSLSLDKSDKDKYLINSRSTHVSLSPEVGYFFVKNLSVGVSFPFSMSWSMTKVESRPVQYGGESYSTGVVPFVRYYIPVNSFFIITEGAYGWEHSKHTYDNLDPRTGMVDGSYEYTDNSKCYSFAAGPAFFINRSTSVEVLAKYRHSDLQPWNHNAIYISIGFHAYLHSYRE